MTAEQRVIPRPSQRHRASGVTVAPRHGSIDLRDTQEPAHEAGPGHVRNGVRSTCLTTGLSLIHI